MRGLLGTLFVAGTLHSANAERAHDEAIALALFEEGRALAADGDLARACPKFEAADRLTGWLGVELNLADCYARLGRTASAWVVFRKAAAKAESIGDERTAYAHARAQSLEPTLARLTITAAFPVEIRFDDLVLTAHELGVAMPIDPGVHRIEARRPGAPERWSRTITATPRDKLVVTVPTLRASHSPPQPRRPRERPYLAWSLGGAGALTLATSLGLAVSAKLRYDTAIEDHCDAQLRCGPDGLAGISIARQRANAATILAGVGVVLGTAGLVVHVTRARTLSIGPHVSSASVGMSVGGLL